MSLAAGTRLGPYEIVRLLGAGGMGEVYRATDERLHRDVALKVLAPALAADPDRMARFEREARAASSLSHPAIVAIHDIGRSEGTAYIAMEFIEGASLRAHLNERPVPTRKLLSIALPVAEGLARAHRSGIVHRDLKPENVMVSTDGVVKIVDFGLAKLVANADEHAATAAAENLTGGGAVLGTAGYMSPEQASGRTVDFRTDQFAFGIMCYEMATGRHPFLRATSPQTQSAIIEHDPPPVRSTNGQLPLPLTWMIERCLAKDPAERYGSTDDLARDLARVRDHLSDPGLTAMGWPATRRRQWAVPVAIAAIALAALASLAVAWVATRPARVTDVTPAEPPTWRRLTFSPGFVHMGRFAADGQTLVYSAAVSGRPLEVYTTTTVRAESRPLGLPPAGLLAVSPTGELALSLGCRIDGATGACPGVLATVPLLGGAPRELARDVVNADFGPNGLAIVQGTVGKLQIEYPPGTVIASRGAGHVRIAPDGTAVAWTGRDVNGATSSVFVRDQNGERAISTGWQFLSGLAWTYDGAVLISGVRAPGCEDCIMRIGLDGSERPLLRGGERLTILDVARDGRLLVDQSESRSLAFVSSLGGAAVRDLSWFNGTISDALSDDGRQLLFTERLFSRRSDDDLYPIFVRPTDGGAATRLGTGYGLAFSPDGRWALSRTRATPSRPQVKLVLLPLGPDQARTLDAADLDINATSTAVFVDANRILFRARARDGALRTYSQSLEGGPPVLLEHEPGAIASLLSPDRTRFVSERPDGSLWISSVAAGVATRIPISLPPGGRVVQWTRDARSLIVSRQIDGGSLDISRLDPASGRFTSMTELKPQKGEIRGLAGRVLISPDGGTLVFGESVRTSTLYLVEGVR